MHTFRLLLLDGWTRHAVRALTTRGSLGGTADSAKAFRDPAWAAREASYHAAALTEVNQCVRRYNALAPYPVRRPLYTLEEELAGVYARGEENVARAMAERISAREADKQVPSGAARDEAPGLEWAWMRVLGDLLADIMRRLARMLRR